MGLQQVNILGITWKMGMLCCAFYLFQVNDLEVELRKHSALHQLVAAPAAAGISLFFQRTTTAMAGQKATLNAHRNTYH